MAVSKKPAAKQTKVTEKPVNKAKPEAVKAEAKPKTATTAKTMAKAGKRSPKAVKAVEEKAQKSERKQSAKTETATAKAKPAAKPPRTRLESRSKKYREVVKQIDKSKTYSLNEAIGLAAKTNPVKFDSSVELHVRLNVDPKQADQNIRDTLVLPSGSGKTVKVAVFAESADVAKAKQAGADLAGGDEFLANLDKGQIDFDILIATPAQMPKLGKHAKLLGPKGLMPNPKSGTVTADVAKAVKEAKAGRVEYRVDPTGIIHLAIGKVSFGEQKLLANADAALNSIRGNKPASVKGTFISSIYLATSMGPSIKVSL